MDTIGKILGSAVERYRRERSLSQEKLAELAGCSKTTVAHIETARQWPGERTAEALAEALGVQTYMLFLPPGCVPAPTAVEALRVLAEQHGMEVRPPRRKRAGGANG